MNCVGIDVSKGKSMIAVMRPFGEVVISPFEVQHTASELSELAKLLKSLDGETRVVMESTGNYHTPVAWLLHDAGLYVSVVNAMLVHDYGNNSLRRAKTDKKDAVKLANYGLDHWLTLPRYVPEEDTRLLLKNCYRQYQQYSKVQTMLKNNLISLLDAVFPEVNRLFNSSPRADGSEKWVDFVSTFWHCQCVSTLPLKSFSARYLKWCRKHGYYFSQEKAFEIHSKAKNCIGVMPRNETTKLLVQQQLHSLRQPLLHSPHSNRRCSLWPLPCPNIPWSWKCSALVLRSVRSSWLKLAMCAASTPKRLWLPLPALTHLCQSGQMDIHSRSISKRGSAALRRTLFLVMGIYLQSAPLDEPVYQFMDKKRSEGKPYKVYMMASANKFLRIYYASVTAYLNTLARI